MEAEDPFSCEFWGFRSGDISRRGLLYPTTTLHGFTTQKTSTSSLSCSQKPEIITQLVKKFPTFYGTRNFITMFTDPYPEMNPVLKLTPCLFKIRFNFIPRSTPNSPTESLPFGYSEPKFCVSYLIHVRCISHPPLLLCFMALITVSICVYERRLKSS